MSEDKLIIENKKLKNMIILYKNKIKDLEKEFKSFKKDRSFIKDKFVPTRIYKNVLENIEKYDDLLRKINHQLLDDIQKYEKILSNVDWYIRSLNEKRELTEDQKRNFLNITNQFRGF